jgi:DNA processing protein
LVDRAATSGIAPLFLTDPAYPRLLAGIVDPPLVLWYQGDVGCLSRPAVAIVGSRAASPYALEVAAHLATELAARGVVVVSGLARGADGAAHRGALAAPGETVAVLGSGTDVIYPPEHRGLARDLALKGLLVSELPPGTAPRPEYFPLRNRIISGLSLAVVVVEASEKSGSLITAACALDQGREVMAVPGNVLSGRNRGSHALINDGARIVECGNDVLEELGLSGWDRRLGDSDGRPSTAAPPWLRSMERGEAYDLDALVQRSGIPGPKLLPRLLELELRGWIRRVEGGRFGRVEGKVVT